MYNTNVGVKYDPNVLKESEIFQEDAITQAVNAFNDELCWGKCRGVKIEAQDVFHPTVNLGGFLILKKTFLKLLEAGIVNVV